MKVLPLLVIICAYFFSCSKTSNKIFTELEHFDHSLDSLMVGETSNSNPHFVFLDDTLKNNPKQIKETNFQVMGNDSMRIGANCHVYLFNNNQLIINQTEDIFGNKYVSQSVYFNDNIDHSFISDLKIKYSTMDTIVKAYVKKYNKEGQLVKMVYAHDWIEVNLHKKVKTREVRDLEVYSHDHLNNNCTKWRRSYFMYKYNVDSIRQVPIERIKIDCNRPISIDSNYAYTYDEYGNWIVKKQILGFEYDEESNTYIRRKPKNYSVYYREISY